MGKDTLLLLLLPAWQVLAYPWLMPLQTLFRLPISSHRLESCIWPSCMSMNTSTEVASHTEGRGQDAPGSQRIRQGQRASGSERATGQKRAKMSSSAFMASPKGMIPNSRGVTVGHRLQSARGIRCCRAVAQQHAVAMWTAWIDQPRESTAITVCNLCISGRICVDA
ncbi:hypothetical protein B0T22DRAFT_436559 [Podospora appendiculata]|uniref:Secreted protein n=1 Tax=Podospora appendiculata TaxID=314037 RepID=A0AAE0XH47_9PEZI|nr:hypothetical protein B0T22DRAFT_436559 [Podospora appendiculata]